MTRCGRQWTPLRVAALTAAGGTDNGTRFGSGQKRDSFRERKDHAAPRGRDRSSKSALTSPTRTPIIRVSNAVVRGRQAGREL